MRVKEDSGDGKLLIIALFHSPLQLICPCDAINDAGRSGGGRDRDRSRSYSPGGKNRGSRGSPSYSPVRRSPRAGASYSRSRSRSPRSRSRS